MIGGEAVDGHDLDRVTQAAFTMGVGGARVTALGHDVEVRVTPTRKEHGRLSVVVAA